MSTIISAQKYIPIIKNNPLNNSNSEIIFIHSNASTFITGEYLYYKLYCLKQFNFEKSTISKIAHIKIIDQNQNEIENTKIELENGFGQGFYFIPTTLKTGNYKLIVYTNWMLNNNLNKQNNIDFTVINPYQSNKEITLTQNKTIKDSLQDITQNEISHFSNTEIKLELNKKEFSNREKINLKVKPLNDKLGKINYSVSIKKIDDLPEPNQINTKEFYNKNINKEDFSSYLNKTVYLPELRGEIVSGKIISKKDSALIENKSISLSIPGKSFDFKIVNTDINGNFTFTLDKTPNISNIAIQLLDENRNEYNIVIDSENIMKYNSLNFPQNISLNSEYKKTLEERSISSQIENAYYEIKTDSLEIKQKDNSFFNSIGTEYKLDDYTRFNTLKETIIEVLFEMYYKENQGKYSMHLRDNFTDSQTFGNPLILVDGLLIQDENEIFNYSMNNIDKIKIVNHAYVYGPKIFSGIINFITKNNDFQSKLSGDFIKYYNFQREKNYKEFYMPDYTNNNLLTRIPDYRYFLAWFPKETIEDKETIISFFTSDISGSFEIILEGFSESGIPISAKETFQVK